MWDGSSSDDKEAVDGKLREEINVPSAMAIPRLSTSALCISDSISSIILSFSSTSQYIPKFSWLLFSSMPLHDADAGAATAPCSGDSATSIVLLLSSSSVNENVEGEKVTADARRTFFELLVFVHEDILPACLCLVQ